MKRSRKLIIASVIGLGLVGGVTAAAHQMGKFHGDRAAWLAERLSHHLDLTAQQSDHLNALMNQVQSARQQLRANFVPDREQVLNLLTAETLDQQKLIDIISAKTRQVENQVPAVVAKLATFSDSLDSLQKAELSELLHWRFSHHRYHADETDTQ